MNAGGGEFSTGTAGQTTTISTGGIVTAGQFAVSGSGNTTIASSISGAGDLAKFGSGLCLLTGTSSHAGTTTIEEGTFLAEGALTGTGLVDVEGGAIGGDGAIGGSLHFGLGAGIVFDPTKTLTINGTTVSFDGFSMADIIGLDFDRRPRHLHPARRPGHLDFAQVSNYGAANAYDLGNGNPPTSSPGASMSSSSPSPRQ